MKLHNISRKSNCLDLPLFTWARERRRKSLPIIGRRLYRAGFPPATAQMICEVSGFGGAT